MLCTYIMYLHTSFVCLMYSTMLAHVIVSTMLGVIDAFFSYEVPRVIMNHLTTLCVGDHMVISDAMNTVDRLMLMLNAFL